MAMCQVNGWRISDFQAISKYVYPCRSTGCLNSRPFSALPLLAEPRKLPLHELIVKAIHLFQHKEKQALRQLNMSENPLVILADAMRNVLNTTLETATNDKAGQKARLDLIDMIPDLQCMLIGEQAFIRNMTWSVSIPLTFEKPLANGVLEAVESCNFASY